MYFHVFHQFIVLEGWSGKEEEKRGGGGGMGGVPLRTLKLDSFQIGNSLIVLTIFILITPNGGPVETNEK